MSSHGRMMYPNRGDKRTSFAVVASNDSPPSNYHDQQTFVLEALCEIIDFGLDMVRLTTKLKAHKWVNDATWLEPGDELVVRFVGGAIAKVSIDRLYVQAMHFWYKNQGIEARRRAMATQPA